MKLRQNGTVSFSIRLAAFQARGGARVKLHHLLQKCSFFLIKLVAFQASGAAYMKFHCKSFFFDLTGRFFGRRLG